MNGDKPKAIYLVAMIALLLLPAFSAFLSFQTGVNFAGEDIHFRPKVLWLSYGVVFLGIAYWQVRVSKGSFRVLPRVDFLLLIALVALSAGLSQFVSLNPGYALTRLWILVLAVLVGYASFSLSILLEEKYNQAIYKALVWSVLLHTPFVLLFIYLSKDTEGLPWDGNIPGWLWVRPYNYFTEVGVAVGVAMLATKTRKTKMADMALFGAVSVCWAMLFWGGGRGAFVGLSGALVVSSVVFPRFAMKMWIIFILSLIIGAVLSLFLWTPDSQSFGLLNMLSRSRVDDVDAFASGRVRMWGYAIDNIKEAPFFGYGLGQIIFLLAPCIPAANNVHFHVHNIILEAVLSWGILGAALFTALLSRTCLRVLTRVRIYTEGEKLPAFFALVALLGHSLLSGTYFHIHSLVYLAICFGICLVPKAAQSHATHD
jgi:O-antigen ligase